MPHGSAVPRKPSERPEPHPGLPVPAGLTPEEASACDRFWLLVEGVPLFDRECSHNGRHGFGCEPCRLVIVEAQKVKRPVRQPWDRPDDGLELAA